ncbi:MAG: DNA repair protein RadC [Eubacteriales bacterium]|nr:DNA repair protein RadC [Bacillota bacterium]MDP3051126.1 DNA repair protein RadC [Eubacteriales bacterium]MDQ7789871.1 DNA repair protein RadC [Clostridia bacterium]MDZ4043771.1 DNA repair protein RadC [Eubacteriales bacterium]MDZ7610911.1 DNA repair protein RadC [Eubacteriales bacterium]
MGVEYRFTIKEMPEEMRPRERMLRNGPEALTDVELIAILLRSGTPTSTALELAAQLLARFEGIRGLMAAGIEELQEVKGIGPAKAIEVRAALELGRRVAAAPAVGRPVIRTPDDAAAVVMENFRHLDREHFGVLVLNTKHQVLAHERVSVGTLNSSSVHPREVFKNAVRRNAAALVLVHNHPSGDPTPSRQDIELTRRLVEAGQIMGIEILDHIIVGDNKYTSFKAEGLL